MKVIRYSGNRFKGITAPDIKETRALYKIKKLNVSVKKKAREDIINPNRRNMKNEEI